MAMKLLVLIAVLVSGFFTACARSNNSDSANTQVSGPSISTVAKLDSVSYVASEGSCGSKGPLRNNGQVGRDSVHLYMNKNGSAVLKEKMYTICWYNGKITNVSLEKKRDTLLVSIDYHEYPQDTIIIHGSRKHIVGHPRYKCGPCYANYEIDIPVEFVGAKYVSINLYTNLYPIAYVKE